VDEPSTAASILLNMVWCVAAWYLELRGMLVVVLCVFSWVLAVFGCLGFVYMMGVVRNLRWVAFFGV